MLEPTINIGSVTLHLYGLIIGIAIYVGWQLAKSRALLYKIPQNLFDSSVVIIPISLSIVFARLYHVLDYRNVYFQDPITILYIHHGGIGIWGAIIGGIIGVCIIAKIKHLNILTLLDLAAPSFALGQAIGRLGNWVNQEGFGPPTNLPWAVPIDPALRPINFINNSLFHPTFIYEAIADIIIFILLLKLSRKFTKPGQTFALYLVFYSTVRFFLEYLRIDTWVAGGLKVAQLISILGIFAALLIFTGAKRHNTNSP